MNAYLAAAGILILVAVGAYVIHRLNLQHADRIAVYRYGSPLPGRRGRGTPQPPSGPDAAESPTTAAESPTTGGRPDDRARGSVHARPAVRRWLAGRPRSGVRTRGR
ncbi:hypothetical protein QNO09_38215 [Streptomyces sp. 378]|uniref:hypothetical protein n=1 Tax=Streptomyces sp. 378 TaxID=3049412 RepID=UPI0024C36612|nr:hypothetical protein [Streptomyces sp. 378]MDK1348988.1 hypothetical protein [Streptomyces sp. 378]